MSWRPVAAWVGRAFLALGAVILLFLAYQLWGTGYAESRSQGALRHQLAGRLPSRQPALEPGGSAAAPNHSSSTALGSTPGGWPAREGSGEGLVDIPKIGVHQVFVEGTATGDLRRGPGHYSGTPLPGQAGNVALAGHRTTYGAPFNKLDDLRPGDRIVVTASWGTFWYDVRRTFVVKPTDVWVIAPTPGSQLTLTTCTPRFSASRRLIVQASLVGSPVAAPVTQALQPISSAPNASSEDWIPLGAWGLVVAVVGVGAYVMAERRRRSWPVYLLSAPPLLIALFLLFSAASALLPDMI
jgi:sortase A